MNFENQITFFFSALGAFNGLLLSIYFATTARRRQFSDYFLALLTLMLCIRIIKSVFFYFNSQLSNIFIPIGLSACILIGPFLYLYLKAYHKKRSVNWVIHSVPFLIGITILGIAYPYVEYREVWSKWIVKGIYSQWAVYIVASFRLIKPIISKLRTEENLKNIDIWLLSVYFGVVVIWLAYSIGAYTSYIVGAISFSFVLYLIALLFMFKINSSSSFFQEKEKYKNKEIDRGKLRAIESSISVLIEEEIFLNPNITLNEFAKRLKIHKHTLSQYLNEKLGKSFTEFINELRIEKAKEYLQTKDKYTIEGIGYESGFNSKSTFFKTFKKITGQTPLDYQKSRIF